MKNLSEHIFNHISFSVTVPFWTLSNIAINGNPKLFLFLYCMSEQGYASNLRIRKILHQRILLDFSVLLKDFILTDTYNE